MRGALDCALGTHFRFEDLLMRHTEGDYLVVEHDKTNRLVRFVDEKFVLRDKQSVKLGDYNEIVDISPRDFIANMGDAPRSGSVYGVQCDANF